MKPEVFNYSDSRSYLRDVLKFKQNRNRGYSARAWSQQMGFKTHSLLSLFLNGVRPVKPKHLKQVLKGLDLSERERKYFEALVHFECAESSTEKEVYEKFLGTFNSNQFSCVELEKFRLIANWYHMAILEMTELKGFKADAKWIASRLGGKVSAYQIQEAIDRLIALGLLKETAGGDLKKTHAQLSTPKDRPSQAIREHHKQVLELAAKAIEEQSVLERDFNSCALTIDKSKLEEAKKAIANFRTTMLSIMEKSGGEETYQLSVQFFRLTEPGPETKKEEKAR